MFATPDSAGAGWARTVQCKYAVRSFDVLLFIFVHKIMWPTKATNWSITLLFLLRNDVHLQTTRT